MSPRPCRPVCRPPPPSVQVETPAGRPEAGRPVCSTELLSGLWASPAPPPPHQRGLLCSSAQQHGQKT